MQSTSNGLAIDLQDVAKVYKGRVHALQGIEMRVARGEVFGLLGPNGAGKSTLVKIMMTVIRPTRAIGTVLGQPVGDKPTLQKVGYLPENHRFPKYLTGRQTLEFFGALSKVDRPTARKRADELLGVVGMSDWADKKISMYSKGMLQRVGIGQALMSDPDLVVLDEPTDGVDPVGRRDIRDVLAKLRQQGKTVFVNSHLLSELEMICDRVAILVQGRVARQGTIDDLTAKSQRYEIELEPGETGLNGLGDMVGAAIEVTWAPKVRKSPPPRGAMPTMSAPGAPGFPVAALPMPSGLPPAAGMPGMPGMPPPVYAGMPPGGMAMPPPINLPPLLGGNLLDGTWAELDGAVLSVGTSEAKRVQPILDALRTKGLVVRRLSPVRQSLEDLFMEAVQNPHTGMAYAPGAGPMQGGVR
jgi:ABC-2 type transport system ATP-binding protein